MADYFLRVATMQLPPFAGKVWEVLLVLIPLSILTFLIRYGRLLWRARTPRVQLTSLAAPVDESKKDAGDGHGEQASIEPRWVGSLLKEELAELRLNASEPIPEASAGPPLLEIVEGIGEGIGDKSQLGRAVGRLFRAVFPEAAYEVSGALRAVDNMRAISIQVVDRTHRHRTWIETVEGASWPEAARMAAAGVAGALYPLVANRHKGPWTSWRKPVPGNLVATYDRARRHEEADRLEQAMGAYHEALRGDPLNPSIRLRIAMLQERLELHLGAWATYRAITDETHRDSWKGAHRRVRLLALYRMAILLGNEDVAMRLVEPIQDPAEAIGKKEVRDALRAERQLVRASWWNRVERLSQVFPIAFAHTSPTRLLDAELRRFREPKDIPEARLRISNAVPSRRLVAQAKRGEWFSQQLRQKNGEGRKVAIERIRRLLEIVSLIHLGQLDIRLRRKPPWRLWRWREWWGYRLPLWRILTRRELSLSAVRVSKLVARIRIVRGAERRLAEGQANDPTMPTAEAAKVTRARERLQRRWPFKAKLWRRPARWLRPRHRIADRRDDAWQYHYNAACAISCAMSGTIEPATHSRTPAEAGLVGAGIGQLEEYVHRAGGDLVLAQASWVAQEDGDLTELRKSPEYKRWARHHLPNAPDVKTQAQAIDTTRVAARIAEDGARGLADRWRSRATLEGTVEPESIAHWWEREVKAWDALIALFAGHSSWKRRWRSIDALQTCLNLDGTPKIIDVRHRADDRQAKENLNSLLTILNGDGGSAALDFHLGSIRAWARERATQARIATRSARRTGVGPRRLRDEALRVARIWARLADTLESELGDGAPTAGASVDECLTAIREEIQGSRQGRLRPSRAFVLGAMDFVAKD